MNAVESLLLTYGGFVVSLAGLVVTIVLAKPQKKLVLAAGSVCLVGIFVGLVQAHRHEQRVEEVSREIVRVLGKDTRTSDDIQQILAYPDPVLLTEALVELAKAQKIGQGLLEVHDDFNREFRVRGYYMLGGGPERQ